MSMSWHDIYYLLIVTKKKTSLNFYDLWTSNAISRDNDSEDQSGGNDPVVEGWLMNETASPVHFIKYRDQKESCIHIMIYSQNHYIECIINFYNVGLINFIHKCTKCNAIVKQTFFGQLFIAQQQKNA